jgi:hypothetical protein
MSPIARKVSMPITARAHKEFIRIASFRAGGPAFAVMSGSLTGTTIVTIAR